MSFSGVLSVRSWVSVFLGFGEYQRGPFRVKMLPPIEVISSLHGL